MTLAQLSCESYEWGSPPPITDGARDVLGGEIDLDPCSSAYWNRHTVRAKRYIDVVEDGLRAQWNVFPGMRIFCNPPSHVVAEFYRRCVSAWEQGASVFWVGFSLEHLLYLQDDGVFAPKWRPRMVPRRRIAWLQGVAEKPQLGLFGAPPAPEELPAPVPQDSPTHGNFLQLLPFQNERCSSITGEGYDQMCRFEDLAGHLGAKVF